ncbi:MAG: glycosyltransferase [Oligoflexia bacterium]|nr:glycosyltransferase [Oligoflexia bacterium]MBF0365008.1 glycosyltransferase [Oligoflexia bacterium]
MITNNSNPGNPGSPGLLLQQNIEDFFDHLAKTRDYWIEKNSYYYADIKSFLRFIIPKNSAVLEIGCGTGDILSAVEPMSGRGVGIDISQEMVQRAQEKYPRLSFQQLRAENIDMLETHEAFDFIIISDTLGHLEDIQKVLQKIKVISNKETRIIFTFHNFLWQPLLKVAEWFHAKMPQERLNWLNHSDLLSLLHIEGYDVIKSGQRFLCPKKIPLLAPLCNKYLVHLPFFNSFGIYNYIVTKVSDACPEDISRTRYSVSVVVPARNEKGNIENAVKRIPKMGKHTEIIFVEGNSTDDTYEEIKRVCDKYATEYDLKYFKQEGKGKGDAVRKGFAHASGDILMILDADLTMPPEELPKFYNAIASGKGEFINGSRLVYPMEKEAMRSLNILGNKFFSMAFTWLLSQRLKDTLCGTKVILKSHYEKLIHNRSYFGDFDPFGDFDLIFGAAKLNLKIVEIPIRYRARTYGDTNISRFYHGLLLLRMVIFAMNKIKFV